MSQTRAPSTDARRELAARDAIDQIFGQLLLGVLGMAFGGVLLVALTWSSGRAARVQELWLTLMLTVAASELYLAFDYRRRRSSHPPAWWVRRLAVPSSAGSLLWGLYSLLIPQFAERHVAELLHLVILCACSAGSVATFSAAKRLALGFLLPMWSVEAVVLATHGSLLLAVGSMVFAGLMVIYVGDASTALISAMEMRHREAELAEQLRRSEAQARAVIDTAVEAIWSTDLQGRIHDANPAASALMGIDHDRFEGRAIADFLPNTGAWMRADEAPSGSFEDTLITPRGQVRSMMVAISVVDPTGGGYVTVMARDISERKALEERLAREAEHDGLTGLPNRLGFFRRADATLDACSTINEDVAVIFVDLDRFKQVNDSLGHAAGDELLRQTSLRLQEEVRDGDLVARLGGDEFVLLLPRPPDTAHLIDCGERLIAALERPFFLGEDEARISASVGIAAVRARATNAGQLVANADIAMYRAKQAGRRQVILFDEELQQNVDAHIRLEQSFRRALERRELEAWLQPIVDLHSGAVVGAEVLTRWRHPEVGIVPPGVFIPLAQEAGLTADLGRWVLDRAADLLEDWAEDASLRRLYLSINISGRHLLTGTVADEIDRKLVQRGIDPGRLLVELTETDLATDLELAHDYLNAIRRLGAEVAIDDFGTGYSSLAYLQELPASTIKIDRRFVSGVDTDNRQATLVGAVLDLAAAFGLHVVAEGIETEAQADAVRRLGGRYGQGFLYSKPVRVEEFERNLLAGPYPGADPTPAPIDQPHQAPAPV